MKDGDVYFWRWKDDGRHKDCGSYGSYHCWSRIAVVKNGILCDTYWFDCKSRVPEDVVIKWQGNIHEMTEINKHEAEYYRPEDKVDMRHANNSGGPIYLKAEAERNSDIMRELAEYQVERSESEIRMAESRIEQLNEAIAEINAGRLDSIYIPMIRD